MLCSPSSSAGMCGPSTCCGSGSSRSNSPSSAPSTATTLPLPPGADEGLACRDAAPTTSACKHGPAASAAPARHGAEAGSRRRHQAGSTRRSASHTRLAHASASSASTAAAPVQKKYHIEQQAVAIAGEGLSDWQLQTFKANPANKGGINDVGLWRFSRHPNYFFETFGWLAYPVLAIDLTGAYPWGFAALVAPACMYWLLVYVSGIPPLEQHMLRTRGDRFRAYQRRTNAFFPGPVRDAS